MSIESDRSEAAGESAASVVGLAPQDVLPGLATALDEEAMKGHFETVFFGGDRRYTVERCTPTRPLYIPGECCVLRYRFQARDTVSGRFLEPIVMARVFESRSACSLYLSGKLAPLATRMRGRAEVAAFAAPAAMIDALNMVVHVWPIDGELPTLVDATDRERMIDVFREELPGSLEEELVVEDCDVEVVSYRRRQRCVLRYTVTGRTSGSGEVRRLIVYGKVSAVGDKTLTSRIIDALHDRNCREVLPRPFTLPRSFGARQELELSLLEAIPGEARIASSLEARLVGRTETGALSLEDMLATCGHVAAMLHSSGIELGRPRTLEDELAGLLPPIAMARQFVPSFADRARAWLERIEARAGQSQPLRLCLGHGDYKHEQLLFDGASSGLVDFDAMCQAEPALDLGKFLAHLRAEARKIQSRASVSSPLGEELAEHFLRAYVDVARDRVDDEERLRLRTSLYEAVALMRLALRSHQDLDAARSELTTTLLEQRMSAIDAERQVTRPRT